MERAQRILKKFSKILKEQGAGPLFTTFKGYVTYALYDRWKVRRLRKFPPRMVKNRILFETNDDFTDNCRALFDYMVANGYNKKYELVWLVHEPEKYKKYQAENVKFVRNFKKNTTIRRAAAYRYALTSAFIFYTKKGSDFCKSLAWLRLQGEQEQPQGIFRLLSGARRCVY